MAPAGPPPPSDSRKRGVAKNLFIVVGCLLVGSVAAFVVPSHVGGIPSKGGFEKAERVRPPLEAGGVAKVTEVREQVPSPPPVAPLTGAYRDPRIPRRMAPGPEMRRPTADVWCEGLSVDRCDDYPKDCELAVYCDGVKFCRSQPTFPSQEACAAEGILGANVACCPGLVPRCGAPENGRAECASLEGDTAEPVCTRCGDGVCGMFEQVCNCPEDCGTGEARPKTRFRGPRPQGPGPQDAFSPDSVKVPGQCLEALKTPVAISNCLTSWSESLFGLRRASELLRVENLAPFTAFDIDLLACLEHTPAHEKCIEALLQRTGDRRLDKLLSPAAPSRGAR